MFTCEPKRLSMVIPVFNEGEIIETNLESLYDYLTKLVEDFEVLVCNNGSTDNTLEKALALSLHYPKTKILSVTNKGLGLGAKAGFLAAQHEIVMFYAIDLPFGLEVIADSLQNITDSDVVIGSKGHKNSIVRVSARRRLASKSYDTLVNFLFELNIKDPQGSLMFRKSQVVPFLQRLRSADFFFETEFLIFARKANLRIKEIPIKYVNPRKGSTVNLAKDGLSTLRQAISLRLRGVPTEPSLRDGQ